MTQTRLTAKHSVSTKPRAVQRQPAEVAEDAPVAMQGKAVAVHHHMYSAKWAWNSASVVVGCQITYGLFMGAL